MFYLRVGFAAAMFLRWIATLFVSSLPAAAGLAMAAAGAAGETGRHPQDGQHVDLRFELRSDALVADISMNLVFLDEVLPPHREQPDRIELSELRAVEGELTARMADLCVITVDGRRIAPRIEGLAMNDPDESLLPLFPISGMRGLRKVRFDLVHPLDSPLGEPSTISFVWHAYPLDLLAIVEPKPRLVIAAELVAQGVRSQMAFSEAEPEYLWHALRGGLDARLTTVPKPAAPRGRTTLVLGGACAAFGIVSVLVAAWRRQRGPAFLGGALVLIGGFLMIRPPNATAELPDAAQAKVIFDAIHANLYRAFDFAEESAIYDALERSVDGPLLEDLFLTIHRSLVMQEEGGAVSRVREVRRDEVKIESIGVVPPSVGHGAADSSPLEMGAGAASELASFIADCRFQVDGRVTHWGHSHDRTYEYQARYRVVARPQGWRIAEVEVISQSRVDSPVPPSEQKPSPADGLLDL
ncbi:MAG: hypothetical protein JNL80_15595 [Phycisphaerae bacterium]|jgi:hypothetical protein|nr:hypothetical protein [Phycisphaerae bacterium]